MALREYWATIGHLYNILRITRFAPFVIFCFVLLIWLPSQSLELVLSLAHGEQVERAIAVTAVSLAFFCATIEIYCFELLSAHLIARPYSDLRRSKALTRLLCVAIGVLASIPMWSLLALIWRAISPLPNYADFPNINTRVVIICALIAPVLIITLLAALGLLYYHILKISSRVHGATHRIRHIICFIVAPLLAVGHWLIVVYWLNKRGDRIVDLGTFYFTFQFFASWVVLFATLSLKADRRNVPLITLFMFFWFAANAWPWNDHHRVSPSVIRDTAQLTQSQVNSSIDWWLERRFNLALARGETQPKIYLVTAQGGGLYAALTSSLLLAKLHERDPLFGEKLFAISSVSGGSAGVSVFVDYLQRLKRPPPISGWPAKDDCKKSVDYWSGAVAQLGIFWRQDFLSPVVAAGLYIDTVLQLIPAKFQVDRAEFFNIAFSAEFLKHVAPVFGEDPSWKSALASGVSQVWRRSSENQHSFPALFFNMTSAESGERVYISPFNADGSATRQLNHFFRDEDFSILQAASMSSRFPFALPPATVVAGSEDGRGTRVVDGGYYENSGVATALELRAMVLSRMAKLSMDRPEFAKLNFTIHLIAVSDAAESGLMDLDRELKAFPEIGTPMSAFMNSRVARGRDYLREARAAFGQLGVTEVIIGEKGFYPALGWYLSKRSVDTLIAKLDTALNDKFLDRDALICSSYGDELNSP